MINVVRRLSRAHDALVLKLCLEFTCLPLPLTLDFGAYAGEAVVPRVVGGQPLSVGLGPMAGPDEASLRSSWRRQLPFNNNKLNRLSYNFQNPP